MDRQEQAVVQRLGRLLDQGVIQLGCRLPMQRCDESNPGA